MSDTREERVRWLSPLPLLVLIGLLLFQIVRSNGYRPYQIVNPRARKPDDGYISLPRAKFMTTHAEEAELLMTITNFITENTRPSDPLFAFPLDGRFYFLANRPNSTRFDIALNTAISRDYEEEAIRDLERSPPPYIIYDKNSLRLGGLNPIPNEERVPLLTQYLFTHYQPLFDIQDTAVMKRIGIPGPARKPGG